MPLTYTVRLVMESSTAKKQMVGQKWKPTSLSEITNLAECDAPNYKPVSIPAHFAIEFTGLDASTSEDMLGMLICDGDKPVDFISFNTLVDKKAAILNVTIPVQIGG